MTDGVTEFIWDEWDDATRESWDVHMETDLRAPFVLIQAFGRALPADAEGVVINMLHDDFTVADANARFWPQTERLKAALLDHRVAGFS